MSKPRRAAQPVKKSGVTATLVAAALTVVGATGAFFSTAVIDESPADTGPQSAFLQRSDALAATAEEISSARTNGALLARQESLSVDSSEVVMLAKKQGYGDGVFLRPAAGRIVSPFGYRIHPVFRVRMFHEGIDIAAPCGNPIYAADDGVVTKTGFHGGAGNAVWIEHQPGLESLYFHLSSFDVKPGDKVKRGDLVGKIGSTGTSTGCHLHFQVEVDHQPVDPMRYLTKS